MKKSTDITVEPGNLLNPSRQVLSLYLDQLRICYLDYLEQWPFLKTCSMYCALVRVISGNTIRAGTSPGYIRKEQTWNSASCSCVDDLFK